MKIWLENRKYYMHLRMIQWFKSIRKIVGRFNALFIDNSHTYGIVKIHKWQLKLFRCVTPDDIYVVTGIYYKLIKSNICEGYENFGINDNTYHAITNVLCNNWQWSKETMFGYRDDAIKFTWMNFSPISLDNVKEWEIIWCKDDVGEVLSNGRP